MNINGRWYEPPSAEVRRKLAAIGGWGYYPDWICEACGGPQMGERKWGKADRCTACGPGDGLAACPADHSGNKKACPLCRGAGFVEEI